MPSTNGCRTSGCTTQSIKEAPTLSDTVAQSAASVHLSHPDPVVGSGVEVFRSSLTGKYENHLRLSLPDAFLASSTSPSNNLDKSGPDDARHLTTQIGFSSGVAAVSSPGRTLYSLKEAPNRSDAVVLPASGQPSRPGPAFGCREGVFQALPRGEYNQAEIIPSPDISLAYSPHSDQSSHQTPESQPAHSIRSLQSRRCHQAQSPGRPSSKDHLNIYYQNVGGINIRASEYRLACSACSFDVIAVTEHWLKPETLSHQVFGSEYEVFRCNRKQFVNSLKKDGGGAAIAVRYRLDARIIEQKEWESVEQVWVAIDRPDHTLFICTAYSPSDQTGNKKLFETIAASISVIASTAFNLADLNWRPRLFVS